MGLNTSHNCWHGSYGNFNRWRKWLASLIKVDLDKMYGFGGWTDWSEVNDDLTILLNHPDNEGNISPEDAGILSKRLYKVIEDNGKDPDTLRSLEICDDYNWIHVVTFADGCREAAENNEYVEFK